MGFLPVIIYAGQDEEEAWARGPTLFEPAQPEYDGSLVLLDHFDTVTQGEGQRDEDQHPGGEGQQVAAEAGARAA